ncbi:hypothetical protein E4T56_gene18893 [Termitomyces sp. T112]|nr:hypothetical protein E4T56_gene18893 [Termitomyces sp. T112]
MIAVLEVGDADIAKDDAEEEIVLGSEMMDDVGSSIAVNFGSIQKIAVGSNGDSYICFDTLTDPQTFIS